MPLPKGWALDDTHQPHITTLQRYVLQAVLLEAIAPFVEAGGTAAAFVKDPGEEIIEAEAFDPFSVHPAGVANYHLGNSGTARKRLKTWPARS